MHKVRGDFHLLNDREKQKVEAVICNNWTDIKAFLVGKGARPRDSEIAFNHGNIMLVYTVNGDRRRSYVSRKSNGRDRAK